jgi:heme-degrading monooxygenase HmoA
VVYARMNTARWNPETFDDAMKLTEDVIIPAYQEHPGFQGYILLTEPGSDKGVAITLWDSEETRESSIEIAMRMTSELRGVLAEPPLTENYEVTFDVRP